MADRLGRDEAGNLWVIDAQGNPVRPASQGPAVGPAIGGNPLIPGQIQAQGLSAAEARGRIATQPYDIRTAKANAERAEIAAREAREQYKSQHPDVTTSGLYGEAYLNTLPPTERNVIKALAEGRLAFPTGAGMRSPAWQQKLQEVAQYDPNFDATDYNARAKARANAVAGPLGKSNNALNTAVGHLGELYGQIGQTASHSFTPANVVQNWWDKTVEGDPGVTNFEQTAGLLADELEAAYRNGGGAEAGVVRNLRSLNANMSRDQKVGVIKNAVNLLASKIAANVSQYNFGTGGKPTWDMLDPHTKAILDQPEFKDIRDKYFAAPAAAASAPPSGGNGGFTPPPSGPTAGNLGASSNGYNESPNPQAGAIWEQSARQGLPYREALKAWHDDAAARGNAGDVPPTPGEYHQVVRYMKGNQNVDYHPFMGVTKNKLDMTGQVMNDAAQNPGAAFGVHYYNSLGAGIPGAVIGPDKMAFYNAVSNQQNPGASMAGDVLGVIGGALGAGKGAKAAAPYLGPVGNFLTKTAGRTALTGDTLFGGVTGATNNPDHPFLGALGGAAAMDAGNVAGRYVLGPGLALAGDTALGQKIANTVLRTKGAFSNTAPGVFSPPAPLSPGQRMVVNPLSKDITDIRTNLQDAADLNLPYMMADAHPKLRQLAGSATRKSPDVLTTVEGIVRPRQLGQGERAIAQVNNLAPVGDVPTMQADILKTARTQSGPLYDAAKSQPVPELTANPALKEVLDRPAAQSAIRKGYETALNNGEDVGTLTYATDPNGNPIQYGNPSWNVIHYARQALDASGETSVRHALDRQIAGLNPGFKAADAKYAGIVKGSDALQAGSDATKMTVTPEAAQRSMSAFPNHGPQFQQGYASNLADMIERQRLSGNPYDLVNGSMGQQSKMNLVFPQGASRFARAQGLEGDMSRTAQETLGGSQTAPRMEADKLFDNPVADAGLELGLMGLTGATPTRFLSRAFQFARDTHRLGVGKAKADAIAPMLFNPDPAANLANLDDLLKVRAARQAYMDQLRARSGQVGSGMFGAPIIYGASQN